MNNFFYPFLLLISFFTAIPCHGAVSLPAFFSKGMVLQQNSEVTIWGWAKPNEEVAITPGWNRQTITVRADINARWSATLVTPKAGGPYDIAFKASNLIVLNDVLVGEVWLCAGQSNMEWSAAMGIEGGEEAIKEADDPLLRFFTVANATADGVQNDCHGNWVSSTPQTMRNFSAVAYFFGRKLRQTLGVPVALINASWGGTNIETWMDPNWLNQRQTLAAAASKIPASEWFPTQPGKTYHAMIAPLVPYRIAGMLWYQGENNLFNADGYAGLLEAMVDGYRMQWGYDFPFYYAQIAPYRYAQPLAGAVVRDAQRLALNIIPNAGMVVLSDVANLDDIHPRDKTTVGERFATLALNRLYGFNELPSSGPIYRTLKNEGNRIRLYFDAADDGLVCRAKELDGFFVASVDRVFHKAQAKIDGNSVVVWANGVKYPVAVRYAFANDATGNLFNKMGWPASCFRTDNWPLVY